jgi:sulfhydrogenase subunit beta (sulfur reductase)
MKKIKKQNVARLLEEWQQEFTVFVPSQASGVSQMAVWDGKDLAFLERNRNTVIPPKANFLPAIQKMFGFRKEKGSYVLEPTDDEPPKQLLFGIHPCDARAISIIDMVFKDAYEDKYYLSRRQNTVLVGMACTGPYDSCFCTSLGFGPADSTDVDIMLTDIGDSLVIEEVTEKGKDVLAGVKEVVAATAADKKKAAAVKEAARAKVDTKIDVAEIGKRLPLAFDNRKFWEEIAAKCVTCGICTFLCPTCYCFDINDEMLRDGSGGARYRNWDCCSFAVYTRMPAENPREDKWRRVRQKVYHKYSFYPELFGVIGCTGCGRCIRQCPVNWDITQTLNSLPAEAPAKKQEAGKPS